ncbi:MAG: hypothetical protein ACRCYU_01510 [Nocardioides sp.]
MDIRSSEPTLLSEPQYPDAGWRGVAAAETSLMTWSNSLYELAGLNDERDRWTILAIDLHAHSHGREPRWTVRVYAADRQELGVSEHSDWAGAAETHGGIPVTSILLHNVSIEDVLKCWKDFGVQLRAGGVQLPLVETGLADYPEQD